MSQRCKHVRQTETGKIECGYLAQEGCELCPKHQAFLVEKERKKEAKLDAEIDRVRQMRINGNAKRNRLRGGL